MNMHEQIKKLCDVLKIDFDKLTNEQMTLLQDILVDIYDEGWKDASYANK